jgi:tetratricopeptide (TPR) repeat protein
MAFESKNAASIAISFYRNAANLDEVGRYEEALQVYDELLARFGQLAIPALQKYLAMALVNKARIVRGIFDRSEEALGMYEDALRRVGTGITLELQMLAAFILKEKRSALTALGRNEEVTQNPKSKPRIS